ncbi:MAG: hypothetical protein J6T62_08515 [Fibrobacter sp.]|nr:hypothetical protein [Fibrobacter sp.]
MHIGNFGLIKVLAASVSFTLAICFAGCSDDSSTGTSNDTKIESEEISSSSMDAEDEEISSSSEADEEEDEEVDEEEAESSSSSKKGEKSSSSSGKKKGKSSSSTAKSKSSSSKSKPSNDEDPEESDNPEEPGETPAEPESSPSSEGEYPDLSVLNDPNLKQGCDIDKNDDVWVIPSFGMAAAKTVYIWKGDMYSVSSVVETDLVLPSLCQSALGTVDSTLAGEEDLKRTCDGGVMRVYSSTPFQKGDRDSLFESATLLCLEEEE